ncbi:MAG: hypothetical protein JEZ10_00555 [Verrucomicrobia bacterium]|nr:hypothetical protein [Verrucomicrobiota bacterium]
MKKWILLIAGTLMFSGAVMADCGTCEVSSDAAKDKAACKMQAAKCEVKGVQDKASCDMKGMKNKAACEVKGAKDKAACEMTDKSCAQAQEKSKKWWKFGFGK